jgi:DNA-binding transcriptional MerR regulator
MEGDKADMKGQPESKTESKKEKSKKGTNEVCISIGKLSGIVNLNPSTIRYYEELGLINPERKNNASHRRYSKKDIITLNLINRAKSLGMSLDEIKELVDLFGLDARQKEGIERALEILDEHISEIDKKIEELKVLRKSICQEKKRLKDML